MSTDLSWYPEDCKELFESASPGTLLEDFLEYLADWRVERQLPQREAPTREQDCEWLKQQVLTVSAGYLAEPRRITCKELLGKCRNEEDRFKFAGQIVGLEIPSVIGIAESPDGTYIDFLQSDDVEVGDEEIPDGTYLIAYEADDAKRLGVWLEIVRSTRGGDQFRARDDEYAFLPMEEWTTLSDALDGLEADHLERIEHNLREELEFDEDFLASIDATEVDPDDFVSRGLERAVNDDRAGRAMRLEYQDQVRCRDVARSGWAGIEHRRRQLERLERRIADLRGQDTADGTDANANADNQ